MCTVIYFILLVLFICLFWSNDQWWKWNDDHWSDCIGLYMLYAGEDLVPESPIQDEESGSWRHWWLQCLQVVVVVAALCSSSVRRCVSARAWRSSMHVTVTTGVPQPHVLWRHRDVTQSADQWRGCYVDLRQLQLSWRASSAMVTCVTSVCTVRSAHESV